MLTGDAQRGEHRERQKISTHHTTGRSGSNSSDLKRGGKEKIRMFGTVWVRGVEMEVWGKDAPGGIGCVVRAPQRAIV